MDGVTKEAFSLLRRVKSVTFATIDPSGPAPMPDARIIDVMLAREDGLYFLTARGKRFYAQLLAAGTAAVCGMTPDYVAVRIKGRIEPCPGREIIDLIFEHNPMMNDLYPGEKRDILEGFRLYSGRGEIFDLSQEPPLRRRFSFGREPAGAPGYRIADSCTGCALCVQACPVDAVKLVGDACVIDGSGCLECGRCAELCPEEAILSPDPL